MSTKLRWIVWGVGVVCFVVAGWDANGLAGACVVLGTCCAVTLLASWDPFERMDVHER